MPIYKYTPGLIEPDILASNLVGRTQELKTIKEILTKAADGGSLDHALLIGPKGIGKSHLLRLVYSAVLGSTKVWGFGKFKQKLVPVILCEEEYVSNLAKLVLLIHKHLTQAALPNLPPLPSGLENAVAIGADERSLAVGYLESWQRRTGKRLLLLTDNIHDIINNMSREDQQALRGLLMTNDSVLLIGAAPTLFDSIVNHNKPLYNFFHIIWLPELSFTQTKQLMTNFARLDGRQDLLKEIPDADAKLHAIHELAGGNPRLVLSLYQLMAEGDITATEELLLRFLDELTPYFRERLRDLSGQQQEIIDAMAQAESRLTPTEIATAARLPVNVVNSQLKRLEEVGYVKKVAKKGKRALYDINERLFSLWRQMRVEAGRRRLTIIIRFLEVWYPKAELQDWLKSCLDEFIAEPTALSEGTLKKIWYIKEAIPEYAGRDEAEVALAAERPNAARAMVMKKLEDDAQNARLWRFLGLIETTAGDYAKGAESLQEAIRLGADDFEIHAFLGKCLIFSDREHEGAKMLKKAVKANENNAWVWNLLGFAYYKMDRFVEADEAWKKATELEPEKALTWVSLGYILFLLDEFARAKKALRRAVGIDSGVPMVWKLLIVLDILLEEIDLALETVEQAANLHIGTEIYDTAVSLTELLMRSQDLANLSKAIDVFTRTANPELNELAKLLAPAQRFLETGDEEVLDRLKPPERLVVDKLLASWGSAGK